VWFHERLQSVQIENQDWRRILERYQGQNYLTYLNPPYVHSTRTNTKYAHELSDFDHQELVEKILDYPNMVMLSGYNNPLYAPLDQAGWFRFDFTTVCHAVGKTRQSGILGKGALKKKAKRVESVWLNPSAHKAWVEKNNQINN
jgi:DNA adenine methylase